ncbi:MAG: SDR family oxidoreductase [Treponemataceae bacterium]|nr:SDR family oxidoreductase [Treponemataceae bacterium]
MSDLIDDLKGKKILIAGASSGIGEACAKYLAECGSKIILSARREKELNRVKDELAGNGHKVYPFDFSNTNDIEKFVKGIVAENGVLDGMVFSVGVASSRPLKTIRPDYIKDVMNINFFSFLELARCFTMRNIYNPEKSSIVAISSISALFGNQSKTAYSASKAAIDASVRCIAKEFHSKNIRANVVNPGWVKTEIYENQIANVGDSADFLDILKRQYQGLIEPIDVAKSVAFLLSDASHFMTGLSVPIDGGRVSSS